MVSSTPPSSHATVGKPDRSPIWVQILVLLALLTLELLLSLVMGRISWNETDVLPLARHFADPTWVAEDWYLNQPAGYRFLFQVIFGNMAAAWGFLATSIVGRFSCYSLFATGIVLLGRKLGLTTPFLLLAISLFLYGGCRELFVNCGSQQGAIANEWMVGGLEAKALAYSVFPLAIWLLLEGQYYGMALLMGLMTSLHVLVGGWVFLATIGWLLLNRKFSSEKPWHWGVIGLIYLGASLFAIQPVLNQLTSPAVTGVIQPSAIYVFLRLPHHLNPLSWASERWIRPIVLLILFTMSVTLIRRTQKADRQLGTLTSEQDASIGLAQFTLMALVPFVLGLIIAPVDTQGQLLQYYPFRLGDVMLPLSTGLLLSSVLQRSFTGQTQKIVLILCIVLLSVVFSTRTVNFFNQAVALREFPGKTQDIDATRRDFYTWIRNNTPTDAQIISPPVKWIDFTWLTERATIAKFKFLPQTKLGIINWYERLGDLGGIGSTWATIQPTQDNREEIEDQLTEGYNRLTTDQVIALMDKYQATYFATVRKHRLDLPIAHRNSDYVLYAKPTGM
ncbi:MAG: hypothetical protein HC769_04025 [Cyanobacteria bacterium CRU_2_1]|nr:hypothetical protein [Cyanobacteria bacterium RU_5_0]NJR58086.1 hypothetical protein [Cyanobacteria bacterium CRU_2_1]